jgi:uridine kinase
MNPDVRRIRRPRRDVKEWGRSVDSVLNHMHRDFVEPSKRWADIHVPEGGHHEVAVDMLATKMASILATT